MMNIFKIYLIIIRLAILTILFFNSLFAQWQSELVQIKDNKIIYKELSGNNRIPDFSYAGYKNGNELIPDIPVIKVIYPIEGDNTSHIQQAIDSIGTIPLSNTGFRGALLLAPGMYEVGGSIKINYDGIIIRGSGDGDNPKSNTILFAKGNSPNQRTVVIAGGGNKSLWRDQVRNTKVNITSDSVFTGSKEFEIEDASGYHVGDNIIIFHPCTEKWLQAVDYGGTHSFEKGSSENDIPWEVDSHPIVFNRYITGITGNKITIDVPVFNNLIKSLSKSYIYKYSRKNIVTKIGIENLRIDIEIAGGEEEAHAMQSLNLIQIEDSWVRGCSFLHFMQSGIITTTASRITIENCRALDPVSKITGMRRYNFQVYTASQQILFKNCHASNGRHHYISNGITLTSGIVFYNCTSSGAYASSEGHRGWSMGILWDNHKELDGPRTGINARLLGLYNRGNAGTSHGWAIANSVAWNCDLSEGDLIVQKPPTAQNYAIGCRGKNITGKKPLAPFDEQEGYIEGSNKPGIFPESLYIRQLQERLNIN